MELEPSEGDVKSPDISDETRRMASTHTLVLEPLHADVAAGDLPDETTVTQHISEGPIANVANDSEATVAYTATSQAPRAKGMGITVAIVAIAAILLVCLAILFIFII